ncbi:MAG TPA: cytochrome P450 [Actinophytocola sp.]|uniref:cytochrome P450 family protein n=1 Tax=Actinophytocola sp. TaxID=1872138 RepID=UPI002DDC91AD|nr:cytochrome P450 [Actinophytocola sp.]HEV2783946.1 cytochrome P450 [Actinophytocola sp.]
MAVDANPRADYLDLTELGQEFVDDPYPFLAELREGEAIRRVVYHGVPAWLVTRFEHAREVFSDMRLSSDLANASDEVRAVPWISGPESLGLTKGMINLDPPAHTRLRRPVAKAFTSRRVGGLRQLTKRIGEELLDAALARGRVDFLQEYAMPLACRGIMGLLGVPAGDTRPFQERCYILLSTDPADLPKLPDALVWLSEYLGGLVAAKRAEPGEDLLSELVAMADEGDRLSDAELRSTMFLLLVAGFATTSSLITNGLLALLTYPDQFAALRADPGLIPSAIEEMLRFDPSAGAALPQFATEDLTLGGVRIRKGEAVIVSLAAANRDPRRFTDPDTFDIRRDEGHIAFAHGIHFCIGAQLARMEGQVAFEVLLERTADVRLAVPREELSWRIHHNPRMLKSLPVILTSTRG